MKQQWTLIVAVAIIAVAIVLSAVILRPKPAPRSYTCPLHGITIQC